MRCKQVQIDKDGCGLYVSITRNGSQWTGFFGGESYENCKIILDAIVKIGYIDVTDYDAVQEKSEC